MPMAAHQKNMWSRSISAVIRFWMMDRCGAGHRQNSVNPCIKPRKSAIKKLKSSTIRILNVTGQENVAEYALT